jgi:hypothetical protein
MNRSPLKREGNELEISVLETDSTIIYSDSTFHDTDKNSFSKGNNGDEAMPLSMLSQLKPGATKGEKGG